MQLTLRMKIIEKVQTAPFGRPRTACHRNFGLGGGSGIAVAVVPG